MVAGAPSLLQLTLGSILSKNGSELKSRLFMAGSVDMWRNFTTATVWKYPDKMRQIVLTAGMYSFFNCIYSDARFYASFASYFGQFFLTETGSTLKWERAKELPLMTSP